MGDLVKMGSGLKLEELYQFLLILDTTLSEKGHIIKDIWWVNICVNSINTRKW